VKPWEAPLDPHAPLHPLRVSRRARRPSRLFR
jgi:hypothetical protein